MGKRESGRRPLTAEENRRRNVARIMSPPKRSMLDRLRGWTWPVEEWWCRHVAQRELYRHLDALHEVWERQDEAVPGTLDRLRADFGSLLAGHDPYLESAWAGCQASVVVPQRVIDLAEDVPGEKWMGVARNPNCALDVHGPESSHWACVLNLTGDDAIWTQWADGSLPVSVVVLKDCLVISGEGEGCGGFADHPGRHSWEL